MAFEPQKAPYPQASLPDGDAGGERQPAGQGQEASVRKRLELELKVHRKGLLFLIIHGKDPLARHRLRLLAWRLTEQAGKELALYSPEAPSARSFLGLASDLSRDPRPMVHWVTPMTLNPLWDRALPFFFAALNERRNLFTHRGYAVLAIEGIDNPLGELRKQAPDLFSVLTIDLAPGDTIPSAPHEGEALPSGSTVIDAARALKQARASRLAALPVEGYTKESSLERLAFGGLDAMAALARECVKKNLPREAKSWQDPLRREAQAIQGELGAHPRLSAFFALLDRSNTSTPRMAEMPSMKGSSPMGKSQDGPPRITAKNWLSLVQPLLDTSELPRTTLPAGWKFASPEEKRHHYLTLLLGLGFPSKAAELLVIWLVERLAKESPPNSLMGPGQDEAEKTANQAIQTPSSSAKAPLAPPQDNLTVHGQGEAEKTTNQAVQTPSDSAGALLVERPVGRHPKHRRCALVIEDIRTHREAAQLVLHDLGFDLLSASTFDEAVNHVRTKCFDLALLDMQLDPMDVDGQQGRILLDQLRTHHPACPVIILSGLAWGGMAVRDFFVEGRVVDFIQKPYSAPKLKEAIENTVLKRKF